MMIKRNRNNFIKVNVVFKKRKKLWFVRFKKCRINAVCGVSQAPRRLMKKEGGIIMAYCTKCGHEISGEKAFCTQCGTKVMAKTKNKGNRKVVIASVIAGIIVFVVIFSVIFLRKGKEVSRGFDTPNEAGSAYLNGFASKDFERMLSAYPDFVIEYNGGEKALIDKMSKNFQSQLGYLEEDGYTLEYVFYPDLNIAFSQSELIEIKEDFSRLYGDDVEIEAASYVAYKTVIYKNGQYYNEGNYNKAWSAIKYKGKWYYINEGSTEIN